MTDEAAITKATNVLHTSILPLGWSSLAGALCRQAKLQQAESSGRSQISVRVAGGLHNSARFITAALHVYIWGLLGRQPVLGGAASAERGQKEPIQHGDELSIVEHHIQHGEVYPSLMLEHLARHAWRGDVLRLAGDFEGSKRQAALNWACICWHSPAPRQVSNLRSQALHKV